MRNFLLVAALAPLVLGTTACDPKCSGGGSSSGDASSGASNDTSGFDPSAPENIPAHENFGSAQQAAMPSDLSGAAGRSDAFSADAQSAGPKDSSQSGSFFDRGGAAPSSFSMSAVRASRPYAGAPKDGGMPVNLTTLASRVQSQHPEIPSAALQKAFQYYMTGAAGNRNYVAIADFNRPSNERRLKIINMNNGSVESFLVAHGSGSGGRYATRFSNQGETHESSLGLYLTGEQYDGEHGRALRLRGMESTNNRAESRGVVMHGAGYVSDEVAQNGMVGRSWGCTAIDFRYRDHIISELKGGAVLLVYHS